MKNIVILISFLLLFLLGGEAVKGQSFEKDSVEYVQPGSTEGCVWQADVLLPIPDCPSGDMILSDVQSLARQLSVRTERMLRLSLAQSKWYSKMLMRKVIRCKDKLTQHISHQFTSIRPLSWETVSEYYVFGIRHILI